MHGNRNRSNVFEHEPEEISDEGKEGFIDFKVKLRANGTIDPGLFGKELTVSERSRFVRGEFIMEKMLVEMSLQMLTDLKISY